MDKVMTDAPLFAILIIWIALIGAVVAAAEDCPKTSKALLWLAALFAAPLLGKVLLALVL